MTSSVRRRLTLHSGFRSSSPVINAISAECIPNLPGPGARGRDTGLCEPPRIWVFNLAHAIAETRREDEVEDAGVGCEQLVRRRAYKRWHVVVYLRRGLQHPLEKQPVEPHNCVLRNTGLLLSAFDALCHTCYNMRQPWRTLEG